MISPYCTLLRLFFSSPGCSTLFIPTRLCFLHVLHLPGLFSVSKFQMLWKGDLTLFLWHNNPGGRSLGSPSQSCIGFETCVPHFLNNIDNIIGLSIPRLVVHNSSCAFTYTAAVLGIFVGGCLFTLYEPTVVNQVYSYHLLY